MSNKAQFDIGRRHGLLLDICADRDLDRTGIHLAAVLLLLYCNSKTGQCNPNQELIAQEMGRTERTVRYGIASLEARWMRQVRHPRRNTCYEWNWDRVSAEEWQSRAGSRTSTQGGSRTSTQGGSRTSTQGGRLPFRSI